jgi:HEAT repeat protein
MLGPQATEAVPALLSGLRDSEPYIAMEAASALGKIGEASVPGLIRGLADKDPIVRHAATYGLGEAGLVAKAAVPALIQELEDPDLQVRSSSAYSLMQIGYPAVAELSNIVDHADANAREAAVREFTRFYRSLRSMEPPLVKMAKAERPALRRQALEALGAMRASDNAALEAMVAGLRDPVLEVRLAALNGLRLIPWRVASALKDLTICLQDTSPKARVWAARLLGGVGPPAKAALPELERCLKDDDASVRSAAGDAIEQIAPGRRLEAAKTPP